jgi:hypothetical protein
MTRFNKRAIIIVADATRDNANNILLRHGYGPDNLSTPLIGINAADDADPVAWCADILVDSPLVALVQKYLDLPNVDAFITPRQQKVLEAKLAERNLKLKPDMSEEFRIELGGVQRLFRVEVFDPKFDTKTRVLNVSGALNNILRIGGSVAKCIPIDYTVTANTTLQFDFLSRYEGQAHTIGFDNNKDMSWAIQYQLYGTSTVGRQAHHNYSGDYQSYEIAVGQDGTGNAAYLVFTAVDTEEMAESIFKNVRLNN